MIIFLPKTKTGLKEMEAKLTKLNLSVSQVVTKLKSKLVKFSLPKFKMESAFDLVDSLEKV